MCAVVLCPETYPGKTAFELFFLKTKQTLPTIFYFCLYITISVNVCQLAFIGLQP